MMFVREMAIIHPNLEMGVNNALIHCVEQCYACAQVCSACADACLGEDLQALPTDCIRLCLDCEDLCLAAGSIASRRTASNETVVAAALRAGAIACACAAEICTRYADHFEPCRICASQCLDCEKACHEAMENLGDAQIPTFLAH
jgi:hypothetical protein